MCYLFNNQDLLIVNKYRFYMNEDIFIMNKYLFLVKQYIFPVNDTINLLLIILCS